MKTNSGIIQAYIDRIDKPTQTIIAVYGISSNDSDEISYKEINLPFKSFAETPMEGDCITLYADTLQLAAPNIGGTLFCEIEYMISGNQANIQKEILQEKCELSGIYGSKNDYEKLKKARSFLWKKSIKIKEDLENANKDCEIFIKNVNFWTDEFEHEDIFSGFIRKICYEKGQNSYINGSDPNSVPNAF